jgi:ABC-type proline/glycine betaine transport system permease subunit
MYRLFGLLIISLSLLTTSIVWQIAMATRLLVNTFSVILIIVVLILGILLLIPQWKEEAYVPDEEIEAELLNSNHKNK